MILHRSHWIDEFPHQVSRTCEINDKSFLKGCWAFRNDLLTWITDMLYSVVRSIRLLDAWAGECRKIRENVDSHDLKTWKGLMPLHLFISCLATHLSTYRYYLLFCASHPVAVHCFVSGKYHPSCWIDPVLFSLSLFYLTPSACSRYVSVHSPSHNSRHYTSPSRSPLVPPWAAPGSHRGPHFFLFRATLRLIGF